MKDIDMEATQDSTAAKANELASLATQLVNAAETRAREEVAQRIAAMLKEAAKGSKTPKEETASQSVSRALDALITAQCMEEAIRSILRPLEEISDAFSIVQAVDACLDKQAAAVDPMIEELQAEERAPTVGSAIPSDVGHRINGELLDIVALLRSASNEAGQLFGLDQAEADADNLTGPSSRIVTLIGVADGKVRTMIRDLGAYV